MSNKKRKVLRNGFWLLFVILTAACVMLNLEMRDAVDENDCEPVSVTVLDVSETAFSKLASSMTDTQLITVMVAHGGEKVKLRGAVDYDKFDKLKGKTYSALLYEGNVYYDLPSVKTSTPLGTIYFSCLGADVICLFLALTFSTRKKENPVS